MAEHHRNGVGMQAVISWLNGWAETLRIMIFDRETYRFLRDYQMEPGDFVEAPRPENGPS